MQNELGRTVTVGTSRIMTCEICSSVTKGPARRKHIYGENRGWRHTDRFWECILCGHRTVATFPVSLQEPKLDPETERLHAQWRKDNEGLLLASRQPAQ
jgi:hypothetical protein